MTRSAPPTDSPQPTGAPATGVTPAAGFAAVTPWSDLRATALLGTDRRAADGADLLDGAAGWAAYRKAGVRPGTAAELGRPAPQDSAPTVRDTAAARLAWLLDGEGLGMDAVSRGAVLDEWLAGAADGGLLVPPELLPALLSHGAREVGRRESIATVGGVRARWLAELNPQWSYLIRVSTSDLSTSDRFPAGESISAESPTWSLGTAAQRVGYLRAARRRDPAAARELLESQWTALTPVERDHLLTSLTIGLAPADEPLLERALDDRRKEVRTAAAELLAALPGSAYNQRMTERALAFVRVDGAEITVQPPVECDKAMRRDGITAKPPAGVGERAWWLEEVLAGTPLATWPVSPTEFARAHLDEAWAVAVHRGLARAAAKQHRPDWASVLLDLLGDGTPTAARDVAAGRHDRECAALLYPVLDPAELVERAVTALAHGRTQVWGLLLASCPPPWPASLARAVLAGLSRLAGQAKLAGDLHQLCRLAAVRLPPECAAEARGRARAVREAEPHSPRLGALESLAELLTFRHEMIQELT